jgi:hypothetical protein
LNSTQGSNVLGNKKSLAQIKDSKLFQKFIQKEKGQPDTTKSTTSLKLTET